MSQEGENQEDTITDSPTKDKETAETPEKDIITDEV